MAISKNIELDNGVKVDGAYLRVEHLTLTKDSMTFQLRKYVVADGPFFSEDVVTAPYILEGENPFKQAYKHLKTLPEFADAVDV